MKIPKVLIIGLDGASFDIIDPLVAAGRMPHVATLLGRAAAARTTCTWPAHTAPGWSSFVTARHPGGHGVFQFFDTKDADYGARIVQSTDLGCSSVWDWLAAAGWSLGLVNVPMSHPPKDLPGYQISWPLQQTISYSRPRSLLAELAANGAHFQSDLATMFRGDMGYLDYAVANVEARTRSMEYLLRTYPTDLAMIVLTEADRVGHHYWHFTDPTHPRYERAPDGSGFDAAIEKVYEALDTAVGRLVAAVPEETTIVLASDHGLAQGRYGVAVHQLLADAGLLATMPVPEPLNGTGRHASWFTTGDRTIDFTRTRAYMPVPGSYGLNVNVAGRQKDGIVPPAEFDAVVGEIVAALENLTVPGTAGERVFAAVLPGATAYPGANGHRGPDVLMIPRDETVLPIPDLDGGDVWRPSWQTGLHRYLGMWAQASARTTPGRLAEPVRIVDLVPTLLAEQGVGWPEGVDGQPIAAALDPHVSTPRPIPEPGADAAPEPRQPVDEDEYTSMRLREMGYL